MFVKRPFNRIYDGQSYLTKQPKYDIYRHINPLFPLFCRQTRSSSSFHFSFESFLDMGFAELLFILPLISYALNTKDKGNKLVWKWKNKCCTDNDIKFMANCSNKYLQNRKNKNISKRLITCKFYQHIKLEYQIATWSVNINTV